MNSGKGAHPATGPLVSAARAGRLSRREFLTRATALGLSAAAARAMIGAAAAETPSAPQPGGVLRMAMAARPIGDPLTWDWPEAANFCRGWLEYLVEVQPDGTLRGMLLESWEADAEARVWTLRLRPGVRWNNGDAFTAADVLHNLTRWCDAGIVGNSMAVRLGAIGDPATGRLRDGAVEVLDDLSLRLHGSRPDAALIVSMADYPAAVTHRSYAGGDPLDPALGTGPWLPDAAALPARALIRNPGHVWWGADALGGPWLDRIEYHDLGADPAAVIRAAAAGEIDADDVTAGEFIDDFAALGWPGSAARSAATLTVRLNRNHPPYDRRALRRAAQLAVDNAVVLELGLHDLGEVAENHHVSPLHPDYAPGINAPADPAAARALLESEGLLDHEFDLISLDDGWQSASCDAVAAQMRDAGFQVRRTVLPDAVYRPGWRDFPFSATEWQMRPLGVQILTLAYRSDGPWNESGFASPAFDALLDQANALIDPEERRVIMARLQRILLEEAVIIQPFWRTFHRHVRPGIHGLEINPLNEHRHSAWWIAPD